jgi:hypothetical protein
LACCVASLLSCVPEGAHSSDRLDDDQGHHVPDPGFPRSLCTCVPSPTRRFWSVDEHHEWCSSAGVSTPRFYRLSTSFGRSPTKLTVDSSSQCLLRPKSHVTEVTSTVKWIFVAWLNRSRARHRSSPRGLSTSPPLLTEAWSLSETSEPWVASREDHVETWPSRKTHSGK